VPIEHSDADRSADRGAPMKKLLLLLIVVGLGVAVARKLRET
jgi:hypothetical protein